MPVILTDFKEIIAKHSDLRWDDVIYAKQRSDITPSTSAVFVRTEEGAHKEDGPIVIDLDRNEVEYVMQVEDFHGIIEILGREPGLLSEFEIIYWVNHYVANGAMPNIPEP